MGEITVEDKLPCEHDVQQDTEAPHVTRSIVALPLEDLGSHEVCRVARRRQESIIGS